jgi:hypothetical protein
MHLSTKSRLDRIEQTIGRGHRHIVVAYQSLDDAGVFRDTDGASYTRGSEGALLDADGKEVVGDPVIVVEYRHDWPGLR